jgi:hypothetical protein
METWRYTTASRLWPTYHVVVRLIAKKGTYDNLELALRLSNSDCLVIDNWAGIENHKGFAIGLRPGISLARDILG